MLTGVSSSDIESSGSRQNILELAIRDSLWPDSSYTSKFTVQMDFSLRKRRLNEGGYVFTAEVSYFLSDIGISLTESVETIQTTFDENVVSGAVTSSVQSYAAQYSDSILSASSVVAPTSYSSSYSAVPFPTHSPTIATQLPTTAAPTLQPPNCTDGQYYAYLGPFGIVSCFNCESGMYASNPSPQCKEAEKGYYAPPGSGSQKECRANTYSDSKRATSCIPCKNSKVCPPRSTTIDACVNPQTSFAFAFIGLCLCSLGIYLYIIGGRLNRMAFIRKETLVKNVSKIYNLLTASLITLNEQYKIADIEKRRKEVVSRWSMILRVFGIAVSFVLIFVIYFIGNIYSTFYTCVILYRGYVSLPRVGIPSLFDRLTLFMDKLAYYVKIPHLVYILYPFNQAVKFFSGLNIDVSAAGVSCIGAQIPLQLLIDCFVVGVTIIVIQSDMEIFWCSAFANVHQEFRRSLLRHQFWKGNVLVNLLFLLWSVILQVIPHPRSILQFGLGFFQIYVFFDTNYHASFSKNCNTKAYYKIDQFLAMLATVIAYLSILPLFFVFAQILVPEFTLEKGVVKMDEHTERKVILQEKKKCPHCGLPLSRFYSNFFSK